MIDVNVYLERWPFRRLPDDELPRLLAKLRGNGVTEAWVGSFDALLHRDVAAVNHRLQKACEEAWSITTDSLKIRPFGCVNPTLPDWEDDLRRCHERHIMPGIRLHPNYHGYTLEDERFVRLLKLATEAGLIVQIAVAMEDERTQSPLVQVDPVDVSPLGELLKSNPDAQIVLLNALRAVRIEQAGELANAGQLYIEIATLESVGGITKLLKAVPADRVLFGSYAPFFYHEAAVLKLQESELGDTLLHQITRDNAQRLIRM